MLFGLAERVHGHLFHPREADGVLNALLLSHLLFRRGHKIHPAKQNGRDEEKTNKGAFIIHFDSDIAK